METLGKIFVGLVLGTISILFGGFLFMKLWVWFIHPVFVGLPVLTFGQSVGITFFISVIKYKQTKEDENRDFDDIVSDWVKSMVLTGLVLGVGWVVFLFIG